MSQKIASLYASIEADTSKLEKGLKESKTKLQGVESAIANVVKVGAGIIGVGVAMKQAFDFGKEGASLEYAAGKFDRLADAAGSTGDVLLGKLRAAVKGTRSDMELMASAGDFMALGLAKTESEVVRLTRVAGALNMDMNQLVLTLTNQTTMRFDQLGVSVDGFKEKVKALEDQGMDTNAAFKEAFLQQAEAQIVKVGDAADTTLGAFNRLEASTGNIANKMKTAFVPILADAAGALDGLLTNQQKVDDVMAAHELDMRKVSKSYVEYIEEMKRAATVTGRFIDANGNLRDSMGNVYKASFALTEIEWKVAQGYYDIQDEGTRAATAHERFADSTKVTAGALGDLWLAQQNEADAWSDTSGAMENYLDTADRVQGKMSDLTLAVKGEVGKSVDDYREKQSDLNGTIEETTKKIEELSKIKTPTKDQQEDLAGLKQKLEDAKLESEKLAKQFELDSKKMLFNMLVTKASVDGLTETEVNNLTRIATHWGIVDQSTADTAMHMNEIDLNDAHLELSKIDTDLSHIFAHPDQKNIKISTEYSVIHTAPSQTGVYVDPQTGVVYGTGHGGGYASGGSFVIPQSYGYEGYPLGPGKTASGGETVTVTPKGAGSQTDALLREIMGLLKAQPRQLRDAFQQVMS